jgi:hypothetical protein
MQYRPPPPLTLVAQCGSIRWWLRIPRQGSDRGWPWPPLVLSHVDSVHGVRVLAVHLETFPPHVHAVRILLSISKQPGVTVVHMCDNTEITADLLTSC